ncbi:SusC/RagA family TonB-linked outer membrane protein [Lunatibacter salilacus]|uniref:SusC/RagA family TonB-linked outer membrane protein n=1 Tax=Lunatibacter salilacus TaxID=2483804 RepID=UPI00131ABEFA|nr:SusC/RagA family TonB-linked outer membrane protein [Lunatibacter salilacus]
MKKNLRSYLLYMSKKLLHISLVQCLTITILFAWDGNAQVKRIDEIRLNIEFKETSIIQAFRQIERETGLNFVYSNKEIGNSDMLTVGKKENLYEILVEISRQTNLHFKQINHNIIVRKHTPSDNGQKEVSIIEQAAVTVNGTVVDENGVPMPGVTILIEGTSTGTVTDIEGKYVIEVEEGAVLVFSFIGYENQIRLIGSSNVIDVRMVEDASSLEEVVVIGYGTKKKRDVLGSVASVSGAEITQLPFGSLDASLQGLAPGVQAVGSGGTPGAPVRVLVRGTNSISSGTDPLYIVDGMPIFSGITGLERSQNTTPQSPLSTINPNDIESIEVLKDAAATAIYGSRGSNGVIIITTKSGKSGVGSTDVNYSTGVSDLYRTADDIGFATTAQWFSIMDQARSNSGLSPYDPNFNINLFIDNPKANMTRQEAESTQTNWFDHILRTGSFQDLNLSTSSGSEKSSYFLSVNYRDDKGVLENNRLQRFSTRANLDFTPANNLKAGARLNFTYTKNNRVKSGGGGLGGDTGGTAGGWVQANYNTLPWYKVENPDHPSGYWNPRSGTNLVANINPDLFLDQVDQYRVLGNVFLDYSLPWVPGLSLRSELSVDFIQNNSVFWVSNTLRELGTSATDQAVTSNNFNYNLYGSYAKSWGQHDVSAVFGTESQSTSFYRRFMFGDQLVGTYQQLGSPDNRIDMFSGVEGERYLRAYFGRADYKFKDKYLLGVSLRNDASSVFTPENRWGTFTALSAGWIISDEAFFDGGEFSLLKLRGSFGQTGNQNIPGNLDITRYNANRRYGVPELIGGGSSIQAIGNRNLVWETTNSYDVGIDYGLLSDRISGSIAYYVQDVKDMLLQVPIPLSTGLDGGSSIWANAGQLINKGWEFSITSVNIDKNNFKWTTNFNFTTNTNKVVGLNPDVDATGQGIIAGQTITRKNGRLGAYFLAEFAGIDAERGVEMIHEIDRAKFLETGETVKTGRLIPATQPNVRDHRIVNEDKTGLPTYFGGLTNSFNYKSFDLSIFLTFMGGNHIYDYAEHRGSYAQRGQFMLRSAIIGNTWTPENRDAEYPQLRWDSSYPWDWNAASGEWVQGVGNYNNESIYHDRFLKRADFMRVRNIQIGYNLPLELMSRLKIQGIRIFASGTNLFTFTDFNGWDPEVINITGGAQSNNLAPGIISNPILPNLRTYSCGINVKF